MERSVRSSFQVLIVDRDDRRRRGMASELTGLGYIQVMEASAPTSAHAIADASPPHVVLVGLASADRCDESECVTTIESVRKISREIQALVYSSPKNETLARRIAMRAGAWDSFVWTELEETLASGAGESTAASRASLEFASDRACTRLFLQFEIESWREKNAALGRSGTAVAVVTRDRLLQAVRDFNELRDLDAVLKRMCIAISEVVSGRPVVYLRWIPIRNAFVAVHSAGADSSVFEVAKGLGFQVRSGLRDALTSLHTFPDLDRFVRDVFRFARYTVFLHGTPDVPVGLFVIDSELSDQDALEPAAELEAVTQLFDLAWSRIQALRDRHNLERIDRGTALPNQRAFRESLDHELVRAQRLRHSLSVAAVMVSADGVDLNDLMENSADSIYRVVGSALRRALRGIDIVANWRRGQFALILPHSTAAEAAVVVDRACRLISRLHLPAYESLGIKALRVQAVLTEYPSLLHDADAIVQLLEDAVYSEGQPRVRVVPVIPGLQAGSDIASDLTVSPDRGGLAL